MYFGATAFDCGPGRRPRLPRSRRARLRASYDLVERGLAWKPDAARTPEFIQLVAEVRERFRTL
jgi:hypothetical protein